MFISHDDKTWMQDEIKKLRKELEALRQWCAKLQKRVELH